MLGAISTVFALGIKEGERKKDMAKVQADVEKHGERITKSEQRIAAFDTTCAVMEQRLGMIEDTSKDTQRMVRRMYERGIGGGA